MRSMTKLLGVLGGVCGLAMTVGCGGARGGQPATAPADYSGASTASGAYPSQPTSAAPAPGYASKSSGEAEDAPPPPPATAMNETQPAPQNRPGLGTEWGESRESHITEVSFLRADAS